MPGSRAQLIQRLQNEMNDLFPGGLTPDDSNDLAILYHALANNLAKLKHEEEAFVASMILPEKVQKGLFLTLLATLGGLFVATVRDLTNLFSLAIGGLLALISGLGGFVIQAILTSWELIGLGVDKAQKIKIEQEKTKAAIGVVNLGLITVGLLTMLGVITFSVAMAPFVIPAIFAAMIGFTFYKENYILYEVQKKMGQLETRLTYLHKKLTNRIIQVSNKNPYIQRLQHQLQQLTTDYLKAVQANNVETVKALRLTIHKTERQIHKILYADPTIQTLSKRISVAEQRKSELKIKEEHAKKKVAALRYAALGVVLLLVGVALSLVSGPLGLLVTLGGIMLLGNQFNKFRKHAEAENAALKKQAFEKEPLPVARLRLVQHRYHDLSRHMKIETKPLEKTTTEAKMTMFDSLTHTLEAAESHKIQNHSSAQSDEIKQPPPLNSPHHH